MSIAAVLLDRRRAWFYRLRDVSRRQRLVGEVLRFMAVGLISTGSAVVLYNLLAYGIVPTPLDGHRTTSYYLANGVGMVISYEMSRRWTFRHHTVENAGLGFISYAVINILSFTIPVGCMWLTRHVFGWTSPLADNLAGNVVGQLVAQVVRFFLFKRFVFQRPIRYTAVYGTEESIELTLPTDPSNGSPAHPAAPVRAEG
jgi:putative flippase GtrA